MAGLSSSEVGKVGRRPANEVAPRSDQWASPISYSRASPVGVVNQRLLGYLVLGLTLAAALVARAVGARLRLLATSLLVVGLGGAPLIIVFSYVAQGIVVPIPGRYALSLIPAGVAVAAATVRDRVPRLVVGGIGTLVFLGTLAFLLRGLV